MRSAGPKRFFQDWDMTLGSLQLLDVIAQSLAQINGGGFWRFDGQVAPNRENPDSLEIEATSSYGSGGRGGAISLFANAQAPKPGAVERGRQLRIVIDFVDHHGAAPRAWMDQNTEMIAAKTLLIVGEDIAYKANRFTGPYDVNQRWLFLEGMWMSQGLSFDHNGNYYTLR
jgi:hypothetical protein